LSCGAVAAGRTVCITRYVCPRDDDDKRVGVRRDIILNTCSSSIYLVACVSQVARTVPLSGPSADRRADEMRVTYVFFRRLDDKTSCPRKKGAHAEATLSPKVPSVGNSARHCYLHTAHTHTTIIIMILSKVKYYILPLRPSAVDESGERVKRAIRE